MDTKRKNWVAGGIVVVCAAICAAKWWPRADAPVGQAAVDQPLDAPAPELVAGFGGLPDAAAPDAGATTEASASAESARTEPASVAAATAEPAALAPSKPDTTSVAQGVDASLDATLAKLAALNPNSSRRGQLETLGEGWQTAPREEARPIESKLPDDRGLEASLAANAVDEFLVGHPLTGVIASAELSSALFGGYVVRAGETLPGTDATLQSVDPNGVTIVQQGRAVRVPMPPFLPRAPTHGAPSDAPTGAAAPAPAPTPNPPAAQPAPAPVPATGSAKMETPTDGSH
jgi:hypothetical protein